MPRLLVSCCVCWPRCRNAVAVVSQKPALRHATALQVTIFGAARGGDRGLSGIHRPARFPGRQRPALCHSEPVLLGAFPIAVAVTTWAYALARTRPAR